MKKKKRLLALLAVMLLVICMAVPVSAAPKISKKKATLKVGQTLQLKMTGTKSKVKWTSSKKSVATVSSKGKVKAKKKGSATITAKVGKKKYTCKITVKKASNSNSGFNSNTNTNTSSKKNVVTYHAESTSDGVVVILQNHYSYVVTVEVNCMYYLNGSPTTLKKVTSYALEPGRKSALQAWNYGGSWDSYKINLNINRADYYKPNAKYISYSTSVGNNNVIAEIKNNGQKNLFTDVAVVYYRNNRIIGYDMKYADVPNPGSTDYLEFSFPRDSNYQLMVPDRYEVYINESYI